MYGKLGHAGRFVHIHRKQVGEQAPDVNRIIREARPMPPEKPVFTGTHGISRRKALGILGVMLTVGPSAAFALDYNKFAGATAKIMRQSSRQIAAVFDPDEQQMMTYIVDIIMPADENPGAVDIGIHEEVMFIISSQGDDALAEVKFALGIIDALTVRMTGVGFIDAPAPVRQEIIALVASTPVFEEFWLTVRALTVLQFYNHPVGYTMVGQPGPNIEQGGFPSPICRR